VILHIQYTGRRENTSNVYTGAQAVLSALAAPAVALLAEGPFGYTPSRTPLAEMPPAEREANALALSGALFWTMMLTWLPCVVCFALLHATAPADQRAFLRAQEIAPGGKVIFTRPCILLT
jgi:hypothetical protein